jgi:hypothetical protein
MPGESHYPSYDVMREQKHWDDHTHHIVTSRLKPSDSFRFFTEKEARMMKTVCFLLTDDQREDPLQFVVNHIDQTLHSDIGEGQRKPGLPPASKLIRDGLKGLSQLSKSRYKKEFADLESSEQQQLLTVISQQSSTTAPGWNGIPPQAFFNKLLSMTLEAYYSHPTVWSEIGYGGPAYPRGYVRTQMGQLDPWEAQPER